MMKKSIFVLLLALCLGLTGCSSGNNKTEESDNKVEDNTVNEDFINSTHQLIKDKGYSIEEIEGLKDFQFVDKVYDNEVLERYNKIQGYMYTEALYEEFFVEGWEEWYNETLLTVVPDEKILKSKKYYHEPDNKTEYKKYKLIGYIILPVVYNQDITHDKNGETIRHFSKFAPCMPNRDNYALKYNSEYDFIYNKKTDYTKVFEKYGLTRELGALRFYNISDYDPIKESIDTKTFDKIYFMEDDDFKKYLDNNSMKTVEINCPDILTEDLKNTYEDEMDVNKKVKVLQFKVK